MPQVRGIIFDLDGTLVDSRLDFDAMRHEMGLPAGVPILEGLANIPDGQVRDRMLEVLRTHELRGADESVLFEGVLEFLSHVNHVGISTAVLTRNSRETTERTLNRWGLSFSQIVTREDAPPKPDPAGVRLIARRWGLPTHQIIVIGDETPTFANEADFSLRDFREAVKLLDQLATGDE